MMQLLLLCSATAFAYSRATYYASANGKKQKELKTALYKIVGNPTVKSYGSLWTWYYDTDRLSDNQVVDRYSNEKRYFSGKNGDAVSGMNKEHGIAQSWWGGGTTGIGADLQHVMPSDATANSKKGNFGMGIVTSQSWTNGSIKVGKGNAGNNGTVNMWEPADKWKGDFARAYFYIVTAYEEKSLVQTEGANTMQNNTYPKLQPWAYELYMKWSREDPVDDMERKRNEAVYGIQDNRNPFIDFEGLEQYIWGTYQNVAFSASNYVNPYGGETPSLQTPTASFALTSKTLEVGDTYQQTLTTNSNGAVSYVSSDPDVASVDVRTGLVTALSVGRTTITAYVDATSTYLSAEATYTIVVTQSGVGPTPEPQPTMAGDYVKVTSAPDDWSGTYLIVYEDGKLAMNGALEALDATKNTIAVTITDGVITDSDEANAAAFTITKADKGYVIKNAKGMSIGQTANSNGLLSSASTDYVNELSMNADGSVNVVGSGGAYLRFNAGTDQMRFRYYKSSSYSGQRAIALYMKQEVVLLIGDVNGDGSISIADVTALVNIVLGRTAEFDEKVADVNGDGSVSVADVTALVNLILGKTNE